MISENATRSFLVYDGWEKGRSIDVISLETGIPRSTVGYYIRKFNKAARRGEPITIQKVEQKRDEKEAAISGFVKGYLYLDLLELIKKGELDRVYKILSILKLLKELEKYISPSEEEKEAFNKNIRYVLEQYLLVVNLARSTGAKGQGHDPSAEAESKFP